MHDDEIRELAQLESELTGPVRSALPGYGASELNAIRTRALAMAGSRAEDGPRRSKPQWTRRRTALSVLAAAAAVLAVAIYGWGGHIQSSAFAAGLAAEALLPQTQALHFSEVVTETDSEGRKTQSLAYEHWIAPGGAATRNQMSLASNARPLIIRITQGPGGRARTGEYEGYAQALAAPADPSESAPRPGMSLRLESVDDGPADLWPVTQNAPISDDPKSPVRWWLDLRADLESGTAEVLGTETMGGKRYWHVRSTDTTFSPLPTFDESGRWVVPDHPAPNWPTSKRTIDALLHEGDYQPKQAVVTEVRNEPDPGYDDRGVRLPQFYTTTAQYDIRSWEAVSSDDVPEGTFDLASISATESTAAKFSYRAHELPGFREFPVWVLPENSQLKVGASRLKPQLDMPGWAVYDRGPSIYSATINPQSVPSLTQLPPQGLETLSDRRLTAIYFLGDNTGLYVVVGSMPRATSGAVNRYLGSKGRLGRSVSGVVNGLRYRGVEALDLSGGVVVVDTTDATVVVAYAQDQLKRSSPLEAVVAALRRANP